MSMLHVDVLTESSSPLFSTQGSGPADLPGGQAEEHKEELYVYTTMFLHVVVRIHDIYLYESVKTL
jgi:hypothetical protein